MADTITVTDPAQLSELLNEVEAIKATFVSLHSAHVNRPTRGKYGAALKELENSDLPLMELSSTKFDNDSQASMQQQFSKAAEKINLTWEPSVVFYNGSKFLVNFDAENAEAKLEQLILRKAGISSKDLYAAAADLDTSTK